MRAIQVVGLGWGDESKGACVEKLTRELPIDTIVRFNGACQCAHNTITPEGVHHTFSQFGSGMIASQTVKTHLSRFMLIEPASMMRESLSLNKKISDVWSRTTVDGDALIITPFHKYLNRLRETMRGDMRHGSCGRGVGVAREFHLKHGKWALFAKDTKNKVIALEKLHFIKNTLMTEIVEREAFLGVDKTKDTINGLLGACMNVYEEWPARIVDSLEPADCMVFEGAQGVLLDETHGTAPHNTWTDTTFNNADTLLDELGVTDRYRIGCLRTYHTRHGAGPFPTEDDRLKAVLPELHNGTGEFQGAFRVGYFDFELAQKAIDIVGGIDCLSLSHLDRLSALGMKENFPDQLEEIFGVPVGMRANGPTAAHRTLTLDRKGICV